MENFKKYFLLGILALLIPVTASFAQQAVAYLYNEGFENVTQTEYTSSAYVDGADNVYYDAYSGTPRLRFDVVSYEGEYSALFDSYDIGTFSQNYLIITKDLSAYNVTNDTLYLNFVWTDYGDETNDNQDAVWIRGSNADSWILVMNLDPGNHSNGDWTAVNDIDIASILGANGQNYSSTFQIRFGQYDNYNYSTDGIAFDNISITKKVALGVADILDQVAFCSKTDVNLVVSNYSGGTASNFTVTLEVQDPNTGNTDTYTYLYSQTLADSSTDTIQIPVNLPEFGVTYNLKAYITNPDEAYLSTLFLQDVITTLPYSEDFTQKNDQWVLGSNFTWETNNERIRGVLGNNVTDSFITPKFKVTNTKFFFGYKLSTDYYTSNDTVFVMMKTGCNDFINIDTIVDNGTDTGKYNNLSYDKYYYNGFDLSSFVNDTVQFKFRFVSQSANNFNLTGFKLFPGYDLEITDIQFDTLPYCASPKYDLVAHFINRGLENQDNISVTIKIYGDKDTTFTVPYGSILTSRQSGILPLGQVDFSQPGKYEVFAQISSSRDDNPDNDIMSKIATIDESVPMTIDKSADYTHYDGTTVHWVTGGTNGNSFTVGTSQIQSDWLNLNDSAYIASFKIGPVLPHSYLSLSYIFESIDGGGIQSYAMGDQDYVAIYISDDCNTFKPVYILTAANYTASSNYQYIEPIDLSEYVGKYIEFKVVVANKSVPDNTDQIRLTIKRIYAGVADVEPVDLDFSSIDTYCSNPSVEVTGSIRNNSPVPADSVYYKFERTGDLQIDEIKTGIIAQLQGETTTTISFGTFDYSLPGTYHNVLSTTLANEPETDNNIYSESIGIHYPIDLPFDETFDPEYSWTKDNFSIAGSEAYTGDLYQNDTAQLFLKNLVNITGSQVTMAVKYKIETYDDSGELIGGYLKDGDSIFIYATTDCGSTYQLLYVLTKDNQPNSTDWLNISHIDLSGFSGENIKLYFLATKNSPLGYYRFTMDEIKIQTSGDAGIADVNVLNREQNIAICGSDNEQVQVNVKNYGINAIQNIPVQLDVIYGSDTVTYTQTVDSLDAGQEDSVLFSGISATYPGTYKLLAKTLLPDDPNSSNDESSTQLFVQNVVSLPYSNDFSAVENTWINQYNWHVSSHYVLSPILYYGDTAELTIDKVGEIEENYKLLLTFYAVSGTSDLDLDGYYLRPGDKFQILASEDCGQTYSVIFEISSDYNGQADTTVEVDLSQFVGKVISLKFAFIKGNEIGAAQVGLDNMEIRIPQPDVSLNQVLVNDGICGKTAEPVYAVISNQSQYDEISNFTVNTVISDNNGVELENFSYTYNNTLEPGDVDTVMIGSFNSATPRQYTVTSTIDFPQDIDGNDLQSSTTFTIWDKFSPYYSNDFNTQDDGWKFDNSSYWSGTKLVFGAVDNGEESYFYSPEFENIPANAVLNFDFSTLSGSFTINDTLFVYYSEDCGDTYNLLYTMTNSSNLTNGVNGTHSVSLSSLAGKDVYFKFVVVSHSAQFQVAIDNFAINYADLALLGIVTETDKFYLGNYNPNDNVFNYAERYITCGSADDSLMVVVENNGRLPVSGFDVTLVASGNQSATFTKTYLETLQPGEKAAIYMGTVNTTNPGLIDLKAYVKYADDQIPDNDTTGFSITTQYIYDIPFDAFDGSRFNEKYYWQNDPNGFATFQTWIGGTQYDVAVQNLDQGNVAYAISPKLYISGDKPYFYAYYTVSNSLNEGHIINDESVEIYVTDDCGSSWTKVWGFDVNNTDFGAQGPLAVDLSQFTGKTVRIMIKVVKGYSPGTFTAAFKDIAVYPYPPVDFVMTTADGQTYTDGESAEVCENTLVSLSNTYGTVGNFSYKILYSDGQQTVQLDDDPNYSWNVEAGNSGTYTLVAWSPSSNQTFSQSIDLRVDPLPTKPLIDGAHEVVSNLPTAEYKASIDYANEYLWSLSAGGYITGDSVATVYWNDGFVGTVVINVQGYNQCGYGPESDDFIVYVEYLNPGSGNSSDNLNKNEQDGSIKVSVYPNPATSAVNLQFDDDSWIGAKYKVVNQLGYSETSGWLSSDNTRIDLTDKTPGLYFIIITTVDGKTATRMVILQ